MSAQEMYWDFLRSVFLICRYITLALINVYISPDNSLSWQSLRFIVPHRSIFIFVSQVSIKTCFYDLIYSCKILMALKSHAEKVMLKYLVYNKVAMIAHFKRPERSNRIQLERIRGGSQQKISTYIIRAISKWHLSLASFNHVT